MDNSTLQLRTPTLNSKICTQTTLYSLTTLHFNSAFQLWTATLNSNSELQLWTPNSKLWTISPEHWIPTPNSKICKRTTLHSKSELQLFNPKLWTPNFELHFLNYKHWTPNSALRQLFTKIIMHALKTLHSKLCKSESTIPSLHYKFWNLNVTTNNQYL